MDTNQHEVKPRSCLVNDEDIEKSSARSGLISSIIKNNVIIHRNEIFAAGIPASVLSSKPNISPISKQEVTRFIDYETNT